MAQDLETIALLSSHPTPIAFPINLSDHKQGVWVPGLPPLPFPWVTVLGKAEVPQHRGPPGGPVPILPGSAPFQDPWEPGFPLLGEAALSESEVVFWDRPLKYHHDPHQSLWEPRRTGPGRG